jgi:transposase
MAADRVGEETVMHEEPLFADLPPVAEPPPRAKTRQSQARVRRPVRTQLEWAPRDLDASLAEDHPARAIWAYLEEIDLEAFYDSIEAVEGEAGRPATDPQVLLALWLLATSEGVGSARRLARLCDEHDAYRWLRGGVPINYHMLADFRVTHQRALDDLLTRILATLLSAGLVSLHRVTQDGLRVRASAGAASFRGKAGLDKALAQARTQVKRLAHATHVPDRDVTQRQQQARERAARERQARVAEALALLPDVAAAKQRQKYTLAEPRRERVREPRVSTTDPEARVMHMPDGGFRPAYNVQLATDAPSQVIVGVAISTRGTDQGEALPMAEQVTERTGQYPAEYLVDGGYVKRDDITTLERSGTSVFAPVRPPRTLTSGREAATPRKDDSAEVIAWRTRMETETAKTIYKQRGATAECVNAHARRYGVLQFGVRGVDKILSVMLLVAITHNLLRWIALTT